MGHNGSPRGRPRPRMTLLLAVLFVAVHALPSANAQQLCFALIGGDSIARAADDPGSAIRVDADAMAHVQGKAPGGTVTVELEFGPFASVPLDQIQTVAGSWETMLTVGKFAVYGVGLYRVVASSGGCTLTAWVRVTGRSPFATVAGGVAAGVLVLGLILQGSGLVRAARGRRGVLRAAVGGVPTGLGALVLAQQFGVIPLTAEWMALWTVAPVAVGSVVAGSLSPRRLERPRLPAPAVPETTVPESRTGTELTVGGEPPPARGGDVMALPPSPRRVHLPRRTRSAGSGSRAHESAAQELPRRAYAVLDCDEVVVAEREFELNVGLSAAPSSGVVGDPMALPPSVTTSYMLGVHVVAEGFALRAGESWRREVVVTADNPYPTFTLHLIPEPQGERIRARTIRATYSANGQTIGLAVRSAAVVRSADLMAEAGVEPQEAGVDIAVPTEQMAPDLTVRVLMSDVGPEGRLLATLESRYPGVQIPDVPLEVDVGRNPDEFARLLINEMNAREGKPGMYQAMLGIGRTIADQLPQPFWDVLSAVAGKAQERGRAPTLLILSEEPYIPWELMAVEPPLDPEAPPILSAQAIVGRWVLGQRRPKLPPPPEVRVGSMAVISGVYGERPGWRRLLEAEEEAKYIAETYGAFRVDARSAEVLGLIGGTSPADLLHFALHGIYDPNSVQHGLVLVDGNTLDPLQVKGSALSGQPFVFLNACQVGSGNQVLGDYSGMAEAFLWAGASGLVAPLWSVKDTIAREIALSFYERAFAGTEPAELLRRERARFSPDADSATHLAYQFFGHPSMKLFRQVA